VHPQFRTPYLAELAAAAMVILMLLIGQLVTAIAFSSVCVLTYYAIANASARTLPARSAKDRTLPIVGLVGCLVIAASQPPAALLTAAAVLAMGAIIWALRHPHGSPGGLSR
jgi:APA family basic amino acid/polyamine antiporter